VTAPSTPTCSGTLPLTFKSGLPVGTIEIDAVPVELLIDTGGFDTVSLGTSVLDGVKPLFSGKTRKFANGRGDKFKAREYRLAGVAVGPHVFGDVAGTEYLFAPDLPPPVPAGYVGLGLLRQFHLTVDYAHAELGLVDRRCPAPDLPEPASWHRVRLESDKDGPRISAVVDGRTRTLLLDTGASYSTIRPSAAPQEERRRAQGWELYTPAAMVAGGGKIEGLELAVVELPGPGTDGILGCNFFADHQVLFNFEEREVLFRKVQPPNPHPCPPPIAD